ncbi:hypothetical protein [Thomasclavelia cocleata]|uniref:hypothetical protein n=1 Tax=Thomasclavelia cocleata TaxID=69824 RepID=UPI00256F373F|nr:hypothetical protein [Thomasclavelia cocleata]
MEQFKRATKEERRREIREIKNMLEDFLKSKDYNVVAHYADRGYIRFDVEIKNQVVENESVGITINFQEW